MSFLALVTLLTATSVENAIINQANALDDWRSGLGFIPAHQIADQTPKRVPAQGEYVLTAVSKDALDDLALTHDVDRITDVDAIITDLNRFDPNDDRIADITRNEEATFSQLPQDNFSEGALNIVSPGDPLRVHQWALDQIGINDATPRGSSQQKIAIIDSGIWDGHPDLAGRVTQHFYTGEGKVESVVPKNDQCRVGHGTYVAGVTSATAFNGLGGRGIAPDAQLIDINALDISTCKEGPTLASTVAAIDLATELKVDVMVMSFGFRWGHCTYTLQHALDRARAAGITVVAAAGNSYQSRLKHQPEVPASCDGVLSVAATHRGGEVAAYSTRNAWIDLAAPGGQAAPPTGLSGFDKQILTTNLPRMATPGSPQLYTGVAGTSFAAPQVAALAALVRQARPQSTPDEIESILEHTASLNTESKPIKTLGWGEINVPRALELAQSTTPLPPRAYELPYPVGPQSVRMSTGISHPITRIGSTQDPISQAVEISRYTFVDRDKDPQKDRRGKAQWGVLARSDVHADALSGASLTLGVGPLLYTTPSLSEQSAKELKRTLSPGSRVYLLGGPHALPATVDDQVRKLGFEPIRLAGDTRIETSIAIANEVRNLVKAQGIDMVPASLITSHDAWSDSVGAGYLGAIAGLPVLLNPKDEVHPKVSEAIKSDELIYAVGGETRLSDHVLWTLRQPRSQGSVIRLAGPDRFHTMIVTAARIERVRTASMSALGIVNFEDEQGWTTALAAAVPSAAFSELPVAVSNTRVDPDVLTYIASIGLPVTVWGPTGTISNDVANQVRGFSTSNYILNNR